MNVDYNWKYHFKLSKKMYNYLIENKPADSNEISAISRSIIHLAYYSCLNITRENNLKYGLKNQTTGAGAHEADISQIIKYDVSDSLDIDLKKLRNNLQQIRGYRVMADYKSNTKVDFYYVRNVMVRIENTYEELVELSNSV